MPDVPPLAGLCSYRRALEATASVDDAVQMLRRIARVERRVALVLAAQLSAVPEWEIKCGLALHLWQDTEHAAWLRERVTEMRKPPHYLDRPDDPAIEGLLEELIRSRSTRELLTGVYAVIKPYVVEIANDHLRVASPLADQPTCRLLRFLLSEERAQLEWGRSALEAVGGVDQGWREHLLAVLYGTEDVQARRAGEPLELARIPRRDERFTQVSDSRGGGPAPDAPTDELVLRMLYVRSGEMELAELLGLTMFEWPAAPFEVQRSLARHLWDECRHAMLGEAALEARGVAWRALPNEISLAAFPNTELEPRRRYALVYAIERPLMKRQADSHTTAGVRASKPAQYDLAVESGDRVAKLVQDFDWADEVLHVHLARKVLAEAYETDAERDLDGADAAARWEAILARDIAARSEWWNEFYATTVAARG